MSSPFDPSRPNRTRPQRSDDFHLSLATLVMGMALGAAAALLLSRAGLPRPEEVLPAGGWKAQVADALAQGRERVISAVEAAKGQAGVEINRKHGNGARHDLNAG